jgi:DNA-binding response OmpR family regulator
MKNNKHVVLYVDDDQDMLDSARIILESSGYIMEEASSAESGTRKFKECNPDFIIVDLMMEEIDSGVNCVKEIKLLGNKAPVFMLSSVGDNLNTITNTSELGLAGVLQKPLEPEKLITALNSRL